MAVIDQAPSENARPVDGRPRLLRFLPPRWRKVARDLAEQRTRTALVVLSIAVGVFGLGTILGARIILARDLTASFQAINPASATVTTFQPFGQDMVDAVESTRSVSVAEGRRNLTVRIKTGPDEWRNMQLVAVPDYKDMTIDKVEPESGTWPPPERGLLIERSALALTEAAVGDTVVVRMPDGRERELEVAGLSHDQYALVYVLDGMAWGHVTFDTLEWLGEPRTFNELHFRVAENADDRAHVEAVTTEVRDKLEDSGRSVYLMQVPNPGEHPLEDIVGAVLLLLGVLGVLALALSGLLVTNTLSAVLTQEVRQIGIMKAVGARTGQLVTLYLAIVVAFGTLSLLVALPLSAIGTRVLSEVMAGFLNFDIIDPRLPLRVIAVQVAVAIIVPVLAGLYPVVAGARVSVREAVSDYGLGRGTFGTGRIDRWLERLRSLGRWLDRPLLLSLRNTFRRKGRLALTLLTLTLAGGIFISIFSVHASALRTIDTILQLFQYDVALQLTQPYRTEKLEQAALSVPGVVRAESWGFASARHIKEEDEGPSGSFFGLMVPMFVFAPPADTDMLNPPIVDGRWLLPEDENAVVVNTGLMGDNPELAVGDSIRLKIEDREADWRIVGVVQAIGPTPIVYANNAYFSRVTGDAGRAAFLATMTSRHDAEFQAEMARQLEEAFEERGLRTALVAYTAQEREEAEALFTSIVALLAMMAVLLAVVGGLGLTGTMSLNVIERTREIGVLRAIGATDLAVLRLVITEGLVVGLLSWTLGLAVALPLSRALTVAVGNALLQTPLTYAFSVTGALVWLGLALVLAAIASFLPAWNASRISVREALAYE